MFKKFIISTFLLVLLFACSKTSDEYLSSADTFYKNKEYNKALPLYEKACEKESLKGCMFLADNYRSGKIINLDNEKSKKYYAKSLYLAEKYCSDNNIYACKTLSFLYEKGYGVNIDLEKSDNAALKACNLGDAASCYKTARINADNINDFILYTDMACENNLAYACLVLGNTYLTGFNENMAEIKKDTEKAIKYINKACEMNNEICLNLADIYISGDDLEQNYNIALKYYEIALKYYDKLCTEKSNDMACRSINNIKAKYSFDNGTIF